MHTQSGDSTPTEFTPQVYDPRDPHDYKMIVALARLGVKLQARDRDSGDWNDNSVMNKGGTPGAYCEYRIALK